MKNVPQEHPDQPVASRPPDLDITTRGVAGRRVVEVRGSVDISTMERFSGTLDELVAEGARGVVVIDVTELDFMSARGMSELVRATRGLREHGSRLLVAGPSATLRRLLTVLGMDEVLELREHGDRTG